MADHSTPTCLITGANRGIGLELVKAFLAKGFKVYATARAPLDATELNATGASVLPLDCSNSDSIKAFPALLGASTTLDMLINNAAIMNAGTSSLEASAESMLAAYQINTVAPLLLVQGLAKNLQLSTAPKVINVTSQMGSIDDNKQGGYTSYRASKAALNMVNKCLSIELPDITFVALHPGYVRTRMTSNQGTIDPDDAAGRIANLIVSLDKTSSGKFLHREGHEIAW
ncbi:hypothetical protein BSLG_007364 [Batrachochytrium salamandrivorans]|nr:hypothetical protein BASA83_011405 [Batrachochytrium salamandrivorans]KAJ1336580.1 hypothetical protein BSLG_007364 [Batrachochytrium salamandrivorans]